MRQPFFIGTYSVPSPWAGAALGHGSGIVRASVDLDSGALTVDSATHEINPAFIVADAARSRLWAATEVVGEGELVSWEVGADGSIGARSAVGTSSLSSCHVTIDELRSVGYVAHFEGGKFALVALGPNGAPIALGTVISLPERSGDIDRAALRSRPHCSILLGEDRLLVTDCGRSIVSMYRIVGAGGDASLELLTSLALPEGTGPRHIAMRKGGEFAYVSNEDSASVSVLSVSSHGEPHIQLIQTAPSPGLGRARSLPSEIAIHPIHGVVYMANRRDESISVFEIDPPTGRLVHRQAVDVRGEWPRHFAVTPDGTMLVVGNQNTDNLVSFHVLPQGDLEWTGHEVAVASPASIAYWQAVTTRD